jgi:hypothetical protein
MMESDKNEEKGKVKIMKAGKKICCNERIEKLNKRKETGKK